MANRVAAAAVKAGGGIERYDLSALDFKGCTGCASCRGKSDGCVLCDDLTEVLKGVAKADSVVLASPNYYGYVSGTFKAFLDRWYSFRDGERNLRITEGRPLLFLMAQGHPDPEGYAQTPAQMKRIFTGYGFTPDFIIGAGLEAPGTFAEDDSLLSALDVAGIKLAEKP